MLLRMGKDWWEKNWKETFFALFLAWIFIASVFAGIMAYEKFGLISFTEHLYLQSGVMSFALCATILRTPRKGRYYFFVLAFLSCFLLIDIVIRLLFSTREIQPGIYRQLLGWNETACILTVKTIFITVLLVIYWFREKFKRSIYVLCLILLSAGAFYISAIHVPLMLREPLSSHKVQRVDGSGVRTYICCGLDTYLLAPSCTPNNPAQARLIRKGKEVLYLPHWDKFSELLGHYSNEAQNDFRFVVDTTPKDTETALLCLFQYIDDSPAYVKFVECPKYLAPVINRNCLSPDGTRLALNNGKIMDFFDTDSVFTAFAEVNEQEHYFIEWTNTREGYMLYYRKEENEAVLLDPLSGEILAVHPLSFCSPEIGSMTLSPNKQRLLYAGEYTNYFFWETIGGCEFSPARAGRSDAYWERESTPTFWINDTDFIYQTRSMELYKINIETRIYTKISQPFAFVFWCDYDPKTERALWSTVTPGETTTIHACTIDELFQR